MIFTDLLRGIILGLVVVLLLERQISMNYLFAMYLVFGLCSAFFMPASASIMPEIISKPLLVSANALRSFAAEFCGIIGPALVGILIGFGGLAAGSLLAALVLGRLGKIGRRGLVAYLAIIADGIGLILLACGAGVVVLALIGLAVREIRELR